jgi:3-oxoacyl-[acyl-carrier protein] reductase
MNIDLNGKVAVVTGSSRGIGASIAKSLAKCGASVVINYNSNKAEADRLLSEIEAQGGKAIAVQANVASLGDVQRMFATVAGSFGKINILVNNAGTFKFSPVESITEEDFYQTYNINILGLILTTQEALKHFPASGGNIINISSVAGQNPGPYTSLYASTKAAVNAHNHLIV